MEKQFAASEVRANAAFRRKTEPELANMLHAYADRLEADEKAQPVGWISSDDLQELSANRADEEGGADGIEILIASHPFAMCNVPVYTYPAPADTERLAEALHSIGERLSSVLCDPFGEVVVRGSDDDRQIIAQALKDLGELAAHSAQAQPKNVSFVRETWTEDADGDRPNLCTICGKPLRYGTRHTACAIAQAQPPAARVTDAMVERGLEACIQDSDARLPRYKVVRSIIEAAQIGADPALSVGGCESVDRHKQMQAAEPVRQFRVVPKGSVWTDVKDPEIWASVTAHPESYETRTLYNDPQPAQVPECQHEWVSGDNQYVKNAEVCLKCNTIRDAKESGR